MGEYKGKKFFTIHMDDAGCGAYEEEYVDWLERELAAKPTLTHEAIDQLFREFHVTECVPRQFGEHHMIGAREWLRLWFAKQAE